jgi:hypothetical protein
MFFSHSRLRFLLKRYSRAALRPEPLERAWHTILVRVQPAWKFDNSGKVFRCRFPLLRRRAVVGPVDVGIPQIASLASYPSSCATAWPTQRCLFLLCSLRKRPLRFCPRPKTKRTPWRTSLSFSPERFPLLRRAVGAGGGGMSHLPVRSRAHALPSCELLWSKNFLELGVGRGADFLDLGAFLGPLQRGVTVDFHDLLHHVLKHRLTKLSFVSS